MTAVVELFERAAINIRAWLMRMFARNQPLPQVLHATVAAATTPQAHSVSEDAAGQSVAGSDSPVLPGAPVAAAATATAVVQAAAVSARKAAPKQTTRQKTPSASRSFKELLDNLGETFANLRRDKDGAMHMHALSDSHRAGLKRIGPLVVDKRIVQDAFGRGESPFHSDNARLPSVFMLALNDGGAAPNGFMSPDFAFGIKIRRAPWVVAKRHTGQAWIFGMAWRSRSGKLFWGHFYAYTENGRVIPAQWLCEKTVSVPGGAYAQRTWETCSWPTDNANASVIACMSAALSIWTTRHNYWSVAVTSGNDRATFLIDPKDTAAAFKDRGLSALAADGKRKRIIHLVREHTQDRSGKLVTIPSHIRGIREFTWGGHHCFVTSPQHHVFSAATFNIEAVDLPENYDSPDMLTLEQVADTLVSLEDSGNTRRAA